MQLHTLYNSYPVSYVLVSHFLVSFAYICSAAEVGDSWHSIRLHYHLVSKWVMYVGKIVK